MTTPDDLDDLGPPPPAGVGDAKLQRWIDLLAALLVRRHPASFEELAKDVPEYDRKLCEAREASEEKRQKTLRESLKRTFERDKDELRAFGVKIEGVADEDGNASGAYRLRHADFYLPYLSLVVPGGKTHAPERRSEWGYRALASLAFEADELQAVVDAAACVRALGDPLLASDAASALRKLAVDLPVDVGAASAATPHVVAPRTRPEAAVFDVLSDALVRRKTVTFAYHAMSTDREEQREVEPYGLVFLSGHWYLVARDRARDGLRNFRLNRVLKPKVNTAKAQTPDYEIPADFRLREHARSRHAWELGDGDAMRAVVELRGASGPVAAARKLGEAVPDAAELRAFQVRRADAFVRWLLSFAGDARPLQPASLVEQFHEAARATAAVYDGAPPDDHALSVSSVPGPSSSADVWQPRGAAAQLRRILAVVPEIADGEDHRLEQVAAQVGTTVATLRHDLFSLSARYDAPGGFVDAVRLFLESDVVSADSSHFLRPMRLTVSELCALELGLAVLRAHRTPDEHATIERARERLRAVIARLDEDPIPDGLYGAALGESGSTAHFATVRTAIAERRQLRLVYRKSGSEAASDRVVCPHGLLAANGVLYVIAWCDVGDAATTGQAIRVFRMDRLEDAQVLDATFEPVPGFTPDAVVTDGRVFTAPEAATMRVRYSPLIARWIAEREGRVPNADGSLVLEHPVADREWAMRHVLQYGPDAEVLAPPALREAVGERIRERMLGV